MVPHTNSRMAVLREVLCRLYTEPKDVRRLLDDAGLDGFIQEITMEGKIANVWHDTLRTLEAGDGLRLLLDLLVSTAPYASNPDLIRAVTAVRIEIGTVQVVGGGRVRETKSAADKAGTPEAAEKSEPYPGLVAYTQDDAAIFYGREREIQSGLAALEICPTLFLTGPSGAGKSSLARAGLIARMDQDARARGRTLAVISLDRPGSRPFEMLASILRNQASGDENSVSNWNRNVTNAIDLSPPAYPHEKSLVDLVGALATRPDREWVLLIDQLEEVAALREPNERLTRDRFLTVLAAFGEGLASATARPSRVRMICMVRSDLLGDLLDHDRFNELYKCSKSIALGVLATAELHQVIKGPLRERAAALEDGLAETIIADVGGDVCSVPLLNQVLRELWQGRSKGRTARLTHARYAALGGVRGVLNTVAREARGQVTPEREAPLTRVLLSLFRYDVGRALRRVVDFEELAKMARCGVAELDAVVAPFAMRRLFVFGGASGERRDVTGEVIRKRTLEVAHEALFEAWEEYRELIKNRGPMQSLHADVHASASRWYAQNHDVNELWGDGVLLRRAEEARDRSEVEFSEPEVKFLHKSRQVIDERKRLERLGFDRARAQNRRLRYALAALGCAALFVVALLAQAWRERNRSERNRARAEALVEFMLKTQEGPLRAAGLTNLYAESVRRVEAYHANVRQSGDEIDSAALGREAAVEAHRGDVLLGRGDLNGALVSYRAALASFDRVAGRDPRSPELLLGLARSHDRIGDVYRRKGNLSAAQDSYLRALGFFERLDTLRPDVHQPDLGHALVKVGDVYVSRGDLEQGLQKYQRALEIRTRLVEREPSNADWQRDLGVVESALADAKCTLGGVTDDVLRLYRNALRRAETLSQDDPSNAVWRTDVVLYSMNLARALVTRPGGRGDAIAQARHAMNEMQSLQRERRLTSEQERFWLPASLAMVSALTRATDEQMRYWQPVVRTGSLRPDSEVEGSERGFLCRAAITLPSSPHDPCLVTVLYGQRVLYGPSAPFECQVTAMDTAYPQVAGRDNATSDGNGTVEVDTAAGVLRVADIARGGRPAFRVQVQVSGRGP